MNKKLIAVLEITQTHVKLAVIKLGHAEKAVSFLGLKQIADTSNQTISKSIEELIKESRVKPESLFVVIPRSSIIARNLRLPSQDPAEIENMLDFQIKERIPYAKEDIISDYLTIIKDPKGYSDVLLATAHKSVIERYVEILNSIKINPRLFSLTSLGISKWYGLYLKNTKKLEKEIALLINLDNAVTDLCFCSGNDLFYSRSISFGLDDTSDEKIEGFIEQLHLTLTTYRKDKNNPEIAKIIIISQSDKIQSLSQKIRSEFSLSVETINPFKYTPELRIPAQDISNLGEISFTAMLGLGLGQEKEELNLLPEEIIKKQEMRSYKKETIFSVSLLILVIVILLSSVLLNIYKKEQYLKEIDATLNKINPQAENVESTTKKLELMKKHLDLSGSGIDIIYDLYNILPSSMSLNVFNLDDRGNLTLQGVSSQMSDIFSFQSDLEKSNNFKNIEVKYASKRRTRTGGLTDFRIECQVNR